jgi:E3 ubiquitin-protein ligase UBR4
VIDENLYTRAEKQLATLSDVLETESADYMTAYKKLESSYRFAKTNEKKSLKSDDFVLHDIVSNFECASKYFSRAQNIKNELTRYRGYRNQSQFGNFSTSNCIICTYQNMIVLLQCIFDWLNYIPVDRPLIVTLLALLEHRESLPDFERIVTAIMVQTSQLYPELHIEAIIKERIFDYVKSSSAMQFSNIRKLVELLNLVVLRNDKNLSIHLKCLVDILLYLGSIPENLASPLICDSIISPLLNTVIRVASGNKLHGDLKHMNFNLSIKSNRKLLSALFFKKSEAEIADYFAFFSSWSANAKLAFGNINSLCEDLKSLDENCWILNCLFSPASLNLRISAQYLLYILSLISTDRLILITDMLMRAIDQIVCRGEYSAEYFKLFLIILESDKAKKYLLEKQSEFKLVEILSTQVERISKYEFSGIGEAIHPLALKGCVDLLCILFSDASSHNIFKCSNLVFNILRCILDLRNLVIQKSKVTEASSESLMSLIESIYSSSEVDRKALLNAYFEALKVCQQNSNHSKRSFLFILEQALRLINPSEHSDILIHLKKIRSQEEFIRGSMSGNPYHISEFSSNGSSPKMRDLKNMIVRELNLMDAENMFELLVNDKIINLDLPVQKVYNAIWKPSMNSRGVDDDEYDSDMDEIDSSAMVVVYRLQGLDGEASEDVVDSISDESVQQKDPELEFSITSAIAECNGFEFILELFLNIGYGDVFEKRLCVLLISLVEYSCRVRSNILQLCTHMGNLLIHELVRLLGLKLCDENLAQLIFNTCSRILCEAYLNADSFVLRLSDPALVLNIDDKVYADLNTILNYAVQSKNGSSQHMKTLMDVTAKLSYSRADLISFIDERLKCVFEINGFEEISWVRKHEHELEMMCFLSASFTDGSLCSKQFQEFFYENRRIYVYIEYLLGLEVEDGCKDKLKEYIAGKELLPYVLRILQGFVHCFYKGQILFGDLKMIRILHILEGISSKTQVGPLAENLLHSLCIENDDLNAKITELRNKAKKDRKTLALSKRSKMLKQMGFSMSSTESLQLKSESNPAVISEHAKDESGLKCVICHEGYQLRPKDMFGIYVYCRPCSDYEQQGIAPFLSTVTHFTVIHYKCHKAAMKADKLLRPPKTEWEGAILRNSQTLCNNMFPIMNSTNSESEYISRYEEYWRNASLLFDEISCKFSSQVKDLWLLLHRIANNKSFSEFSKGGGQDSNAQLISYMLQMGCFTLMKMSADRLATEQKRLYDEFDQVCLSGSFDSLRFEMLLVSSVYLLDASSWSLFRSRIPSDVCVGVLSCVVKIHGQLSSVSDKYGYLSRGGRVVIF